MARARPPATGRPDAAGRGRGKPSPAAGCARPRVFSPWPWLGWGSFHAFGYAGYLFPVLLALYGVSAFVRPRVAHGWQAGVGLLILLVSATGILARASDTLAEYRLHKGGVVGWAVSEGLMVSIGTVGTWIILLALIPVGVLFVTRIPYGVLSRTLRARFGRLRRPEGKKSLRGSPASDLPLTRCWVTAVPPP